MIDIQVKLHDRYSVECKVGYHVDRDTEENEFRMNAWFFIPHSLDINASTYPKDFYIIKSIRNEDNLWKNSKKPPHL